MLYDLSHTVQNGMAVFPGDSGVTFDHTSMYDHGGFAVGRILFGAHTGTHVDAPRHVIPDGPGIGDDALLAKFVGEAAIIDVRGRLVNNEITPDSLGGDRDLIRPGARLLFATGWSANFGAPSFYRGFPGISLELATLFADTGIALVGLESPSVNTQNGLIIHRTLLGAGVVIVESLKGLADLGAGTVFFSAAPLKLDGMDGSPVRAYALVPGPDAR